MNIFARIRNLFKTKGFKERQAEENRLTAMAQQRASSSGSVTKKQSQEKGFEQPPPAPADMPAETPAGKHHKPTRKRKRPSSPAPGPPPAPPVQTYDSVVLTRKKAGRPPHQPALRLNNVLGSICFASSGTNLILAAPAIVQFFGHLAPSASLTGQMGVLARNPPDQVLDTSIGMSAHTVPFRSPM